MGMNYYLKEKPCPTCGHAEQTLHIGKSSWGWCFSLHVDKAEGIEDLADWESRWSEGTIENEEKETITPEKMLEIITDRQGQMDWEKPKDIPGYRDSKQFHDANGSEPGPNGLLRHRVGLHCVKHGFGTWDCITGEFS
jgi:hypothetical protein